MLQKTYIALFLKALIVMMVVMVAVSSTAYAGSNDSKLQANSDEVYYMITFLSGADFWKGCYLGFEEAAALYGAKTVYAGAPEYDITKAVTVFEQIVAKKPTGIALTCMNPEPFIEPIKKAIGMGIKVVTFDSDSPQSARASFISTDNQDAGRVAARYLAKGMGGKGNIAVIVRPAQLNVFVRYLGFKEVIEKEFPDMKIVQVIEAEGDQTKAASATAAVLQAHPEINAIFSSSGIEAVGAGTAIREAGRKDIKLLAFDTPSALLDMIENGEAWATGVQNTYLMGYFSMISLFHLVHDLSNPMTDWKTNPDVSPIAPFINTGINFATQGNVKHYYLRK